MIFGPSPARMKGQKRAVYDYVFGIIGEQGEYFYCCSCCEWFSGVVGHPTIDNSNTTMLEKLHLLLQNARGESAWVIPEADEIIEFRDRDSTGTSLGRVPMKVYTVLKKYLHWDFESVACYLCVVSFVLLRGIWLKKPVGHILSFVSEARLCNFLKQSQAIDSIMKEVELVGNSGEYNFDLVKIALKKKRYHN